MEGKVSGNELMTSVLRNVVEQPLSLPGYANYILVLICKLLSLHCGSEYSNTKITCTFILFCESWKKKNLFKVFSYAWCRCPLKHVWNKISQISKYFLDFLLFKMHWYPFSVLSCKLYVIKKINDNYMFKTPGEAKSAKKKKKSSMNIDQVCGVTYDIKLLLTHFLLGLYVKC